MERKTVLLGLSGGVDSAVAALLLKRQGYEVIGAFMKNFSDTKNKFTGECNWVEERAMAQKIAAILNIQFITLDFEKEYKKQVIEPMFKAYKTGLTPNPDIACNTIIKFPLLWKEAHKLGADYIATGHYARIKRTKREYKLLAGKDKTKDQSYFLSDLKQEDLKHTLFPIGEYTKEQVRQIAKKNKFPNYDKQGSRGICFVGKIAIKSFLQQKIKKKIGIVYDDKKKEIGNHEGIMYYTIGERVGPSIGINLDSKKINSSEKYYIAEKNAKKNSLVAVPENHPLLFKKSFMIKDIHWIGKENKNNIKVRIRHLGPLLSAKLSKKGKNYICTLKKSIKGLASGQQAAIYQNSIVLGSGQIII